MALFNRGVTPTSPDSYLTRLVDADHAARTLGIKASRWRQIATPRDSDPTIPLIREPGVRGAQWRLRDVYTHAMTDNRTLTTALPALLPLPTGEARYQRAARPRALRSSQTNSAPSVWADMFDPVWSERNGHLEPLLLLLTPLWPTEWPRVLAELDQVIAAALTTTDWATDLARGDRGMCVVLNGSEPGWGSVRWAEVDPRWLAQVSTAGLRPDEVVTDAWRFDHYTAPAVDIAACLGWPALPWWPKGTASRSLCALWEPGKPVTTDIPERLSDRRRAATWLASRTVDTPNIFDAFLADAFDDPSWLSRGRATDVDYGALARMLDPAHTEGFADQQARRTTAVPDGFELAVNLTWEPVSPAPVPAAQPMRALDHVLGSLATPADLGRVILDWVGDPTYTLPAHCPWTALPEPWRQELQTPIADYVDEGDTTSPRWQRLLRAHQTYLDEAGVTDDDQPRFVELGTLQAPAVLDEHGITFCSPTGYRPFRDDQEDQPGQALAAPDDDDDKPFEVLLLTDAQDQTRGLVRFVSGRIAPLPGKSQVMTGPIGQAAVIAAAVTGATTESVTGDFVHYVEHDPLVELIGKATIDTPLVVSFGTLTETVADSLRQHRAAAR